MQLKSLHILLLLLVSGCVQAQVNEKVFDNSITNKNLAFYQNELAVHERSGTRENIIDDLVNLGNGYMRQHDYPNAIQGFLRVVILYEELKNHSGMADMLINIADAYRELSDFPHLLEYLQKATREYEKAGNESGLAKTLRSTGYYYLNLSYDRAPAIPYFQQSLIFYKKLDKQKEEHIHY